jgi:hypothetical protein
MIKYYIYHIEGVKWGCTINLEKRLKVQGYNIASIKEVIEKYDIDEAAELEKQLNIEYNYSWNDGQDYRMIVNALKKTYKNKVRYTPEHTFTKKDCQLGGYITGKKKGEKQQIARRNNVSKINIYKTCPYCNLTTRGAAYHRYHGEKCKHKI